MNAEAIIALCALVATVVFGAFAWVFKFSVTQTLKGIEGKQSELETRQKECEADNKEMSNRLRIDENQTTKIQGQLEKFEVRLEHVASAVGELKEQQVPRGEWDRQMSHVISRVDEIAREVRSLRPGSYSQQRSGDSGPFVPVQKK